MLVHVYKSSKKADTYLYVVQRDDFEAVPAALMESFGRPLFVMTVPLTKREKLAIVDKQKLLDEIQQKGFYLQLPPPPENLLKQHLQANSAKSNQQEN